MLDSLIFIFLLAAFIAANLPWVSERVFGLISTKSGTKSAWLCFLEWFILYILVGFIALGLEKQANSEIYSQDWEFYAVTVCLFLVFALPGFVYRYDLKHLLQRAK